LVFFFSLLILEGLARVTFLDEEEEEEEDEEESRSRFFLSFFFFFFFFLSFLSFFFFFFSSFTIDFGTVMTCCLAKSAKLISSSEELSL
jgi:ATP-dependent Zn protease